MTDVHMQKPQQLWLLLYKDVEKRERCGDHATLLGSRMDTEEGEKTGTRERNEAGNEAQREETGATRTLLALYVHSRQTPLSPLGGKGKEPNEWVRRGGGAERGPLLPPSLINKKPEQKKKIHRQQF